LALSIQGVRRRDSQLATHIQPGDEDYWRLAPPRQLHRDMAEILFPRQKGKPLFGARLIEAYEQAGIVYRRAAGDPDQYLLPDETRSALTAKARREGLLQSEVASVLHSKLAKYFDNQHGIRIEAVIKSEVDEQSLNKDHPALIEAAYHVVMSYVPSRQEKNKVDPERFWRSMAGSIWLNNLDKRLNASTNNGRSRLAKNYVNWGGQAGWLHAGQEILIFFRKGLKNLITKPSG